MLSKGIVDASILFFVPRPRGEQFCLARDPTYYEMLYHRLKTNKLTNEGRQLFLSTTPKTNHFCSQVAVSGVCDSDGKLTNTGSHSLMHSEHPENASDWSLKALCGFITHLGQTTWKTWYFHLRCLTESYQGPNVVDIIIFLGDRAKPKIVSLVSQARNGRTETNLTPHPTKKLLFLCKATF